MRIDNDLLKKYRATIELHVTSQKAMKFYLHWVKYQDWQLEQANDSFRLLFGECLALPWANPWPVRANNPDLPPGGQTPLRRQTSLNNFKDTINLKGVEVRCPGLLARIRTILRTLHYAYKTEKTYLEWICRYINFIELQDPGESGANEVKQYLEYLATIREVAGNTQRQALNAIVFLYAQVLEKPLGEIGAYAKPKKPQRLPVVFTPEEVDKVLQAINGEVYLPSALAGKYPNTLSEWGWQ